MQWQGNIIFLFVLIFLFDFVNCLEVGASPSVIKATLLNGEESCYNINIFSSGNLREVNVYDYWSEGHSKEIVDFKRNSADFDLVLGYEDSFMVRDNKDFNFCIKGMKKGEYYGVLLFESEKYNVVIGVWLEVIVLGGENKLTGYNILNSKNINAVAIQLVITFILIIIFLYMLVRLRR